MRIIISIFVFFFTIGGIGICNADPPEIEITPELALKTIEDTQGLDTDMITTYWILAGKPMPEVEPWEGTAQEMLDRDANPQFVVTYGTPFKIHNLDNEANIKPTNQMNVPVYINGESSAMITVGIINNEVMIARHGARRVMESINSLGLVFSDTVRFVEAMNIGKIFIADTENDKVYVVSPDSDSTPTDLGKFLLDAKELIGVEVNKEIKSTDSLTEKNEITPELALKAIENTQGLDTDMITTYWILAGKPMPEVEFWEGTLDELMKRKDCKPQFVVTYGNPFKIHNLDNEGNIKPTNQMNVPVYINGEASAMITVGIINNEVMIARHGARRVMESINSLGLVFSDTVRFVEAMNIGKIFIADTENDKAYFVSPNSDHTPVSLSKFMKEATDVSND